MLTAPILYVGEDLCRRIPVIERYGGWVRRTPCSAPEVSAALSESPEYAAVAFNEDLAPIPPDVLTVARSYPSPLVLFENPSHSSDSADFDLIIPTLTHPGLWLQFIQETINESRKLRAEAQALRQDAAAVRGDSCATINAPRSRQSHRPRQALAHQLNPCSCPCKATFLLPAARRRLADTLDRLDLL